MAGGASAVHSASAARVTGPQAREQMRHHAWQELHRRAGVTIHVVKGCQVVRPAQDHGNGLEAGHFGGRRACRPGRPPPALTHSHTGPEQLVR